jgi:hypothetical protein
MHIQWLFLMLGVGGIAMFCGGCRRKGKGGRPTALSLIAVAAIVGGFIMFAHKADDRHEVADAQHFDHVRLAERVRNEHANFGQRIRDKITREVHEGLSELDEIHDIDVDVDFDPQFPLADGMPDEFSRHEKPAFGRIGMIALGSVLLICGWLLFNRDRSRPFAMKAVTVLGLAATGAILFSFVRSDSPPRHLADQDTVVKVSADDEVRPPRPAHETPPSPPRPIRRAKRPIARSEGGHDDTPDQLPPRAGEIPVAAELAKTSESAGEPAAAAKPVESNAESQPPAPPAAEAEPSPPAEPTPPAEPAEADENEDGSVKDKSDEPQVAEPKVAEPKVDEPKIDEPVADAHATSDSPEQAAASSDELPDWANKPAKLVNGVYRVSIQSGLYADVPECQRALEGQIKTQVDEYIDRWMGPGTAALVAIDREYLNKHIKKDEVSEVVNTSTVGPMHQIHALLEFDDAARAEFHERWRRAVVTERVWVVGFGSAVVLALLSTAFGYLKLDQQTGGRQSGRLGVAATLVALIVAAGALLVRSGVGF